jgi:hypothetical protein
VLGWLMGAGSPAAMQPRVGSLDWLAGIFTGMNIARGPGKQVDLPELDSLVRAILADSGTAQPRHG